MRKAGWLLFAAVAVAAIWSGGWLYASRETARQIDGWIASERAQGRDWSCSGRRIGGYPFALTFGCTDAAYSGEAMGQRIETKIARLAGTVALIHPRQLDLTLQPPLSYRTSDGQTQLGGRWQALDITVSSLPAIRTVEISGRGLALAGQIAGSAAANGATTFDARFDLVSARADPALAFVVDAKELAVPPLDQVLGGTMPVDIEAGGRIENADVGDARTPEEALDHWRRAGGHLDLANALIRRGTASVAATGTLGLHDEHRVQGHRDAQFVGLEPILARYGISGNLAAVGSLVSALFGGGARRPPPKPGALNLPMSLNNGRLGIGPIVTAVQLTPLY